MANDKIFAKGVYFKINDNAPEFVVGQISINVKEILPFLDEHINSAGYVNLDIKKGQSGKYYIELNTFEGSGKNYVRHREPDNGTHFNPDFNDNISL